MIHIWKIAPGKNAKRWEMCRQDGCILIGWPKLSDFRKFKNEKQIIKELGGGQGNGAGAAKSIWYFTHNIQPGDIVIANKGRSRVVGIGVVKSTYLPPNSSANPSKSTNLTHARLVKWLIDKPVDLERYFFGIDTVHALTAVKVGQIKQAYLKKYPKLKETLDQLFNNADDSSTNGLLATVEQQAIDEDAFDPAGIEDARERTISLIVRRRGQPTFRKRLLEAYKSRCAITGCEVEAVLEAAHIVPYKGSKTNHPGNGLLLRADLHTLFDLRLVSVDAAKMHVWVSPKLAGTPYDKYFGRRLRIPDDSASQPNKEALEQHRREADL